GFTGNVVIIRPAAVSPACPMASASRSKPYSRACHQAPRLILRSWNEDCAVSSNSAAELAGTVFARPANMGDEGFAVLFLAWLLARPAHGRPRVGLCAQRSVQLYQRSDRRDSWCAHRGRRRRIGGKRI